ncbi:MAG: hypothetical protein P0Y62_05530 [Candidatus Chryseobacterium colombiense]|nr:hypothetical protein [Chryseobacterium sp.]WEK71017.1 MAG: hypothetical protein P0Y62_05530 [Chryseobacterium sp.]
MESELIDLELKINEMLDEFQHKHNCVIGVLNEDYTLFDNDKAHDGIRGSLVQLSVVPIEEKTED